MKRRHTDEPIPVKHLCIFLLLVTVLALPLTLTAQPADTAIGGHLVGTVLGEAEGLAEHDFRTDADVLQLTDFAFLANGDMIVADGIQGRILRVPPDGIVHPFAGNGSSTDSGIGGNALDAGMPGITHLATDGSGNVYVAQTVGSYSVMRKITTDGIIHTVAGKAEIGCPEPGSVAAVSPIGRVTAFTSDQEGNLYFASIGCLKVFRIDQDGVIGLAGVDADAEQLEPIPGGSVSIPAAIAQFSNVLDLAADEIGNVWVAQDGGQSRLALISPQGVATFVGNAAIPSDPREGPMDQIGYALMESLAPIPGGGMAIARNDTFLSLQVEHQNRSELGVIDAQGNYALLLARDGFNGTASPEFQGIPLNPRRVRVSPTGEIYFQDGRGESIFQVSENGALTHFFRAFRRVENVIPDAVSPTFRILAPTNLVSDLAGNLYVGDRTAHKIYRLGTDGLLTHIAGNGSAASSGDGGSPLDAGVSVGPQIGIDAEGRIYVVNDVADLTTRRIRRFAVDGVIETILGGGSSPTAEGSDGTSVSIEGFNLAWGVGPNGAVYYFRANENFSAASDFIWRLGPDGKLARFLGSEEVGASTGLKDQPALGAYLKSIPRSLVVDASGMVFFQPAVGIDTFYVDAEGVVRSLTNTGSPNGDLVDGAPTSEAPLPTQLAGHSWSAGGLLAYAGGPSSLVEYRVGGTIRILRKGGSGLLRQDGAFLRDDRMQYNRSVVPLPDGGLAWTEKANNYVTIRRSFPVAETCTYTLHTDELSVGGGNNLAQFSLTTDSGCPWTAGSSASWVQILSARTGNGGTTVQLRALANPSPAQRVARVRIAGKEMLIRQEASTRQDLFFLSPSTATVPVSGGVVELRITASPQQEWQISLPDGPITLLGHAGGSGSATIQFRVDALPAGTPARTLTVQVNGVPFPISQEAPVVPVPVTISSALPGATAVVDLVERQLPYETNWIPGSFHHLKTNRFQTVSDDTVQHFEGWSDGSTDAERVVTAPSHASTFGLLARQLHRLRLTPLVNTNPASITPALSRRGFVLPNEASASVPNPQVGHWFAEGATVSVLAPNGEGARFVSFSGDLVSTANPSALTMDGPLEVNVNYSPDSELAPAFRVGGVGNWRFFDASRETNPAQITVVPSQEGSNAESTIFVSYQDAENPLPWLEVRPGAGVSPLTVELAIDAEAAAASASGSATIYLHTPNGTTTSAEARYYETNPAEPGSPWIAAVTDAGGFRQSVSDSQDVAEHFVAAPGMILSMFGQDLADDTAVAESLPLPTMLGNTLLEYLLPDGSAWRAAPLFFVSPTQINFQIPPDLEVASAAGISLTLRVRRGSLPYGGPYNITVRPRSASFFTAGSRGFGPPAGHYARLRSSGIQERGPLFVCPAEVTEPCEPGAIPVGSEGEEVYLELFGTGFANPGSDGDLMVFLDGKPLEITYAGAHSAYAGLDQLNVKVPNDVRRSAPLDLYLWVKNGDRAWLASNRLTVVFE